jgi:hypothetical protein
MSFGLLSPAFYGTLAAVEMETREVMVMMYHRRT